MALRISYSKMGRSSLVNNLDNISESRYSKGFLDHAKYMYLISFQLVVTLVVLKLVIKENSKVIVGFNSVRWNCIKTIEAMMVTWTKMEMLTFRDVKVYCRADLSHSVIQCT